VVALTSKKCENSSTDCATLTLLLGLGIIGIRCADQITAAGKKLTTWNRTPKDRSDSTTDLVASASEAEVISCYLRDDLAVREIFAQIKDSLHEGQTFINHATIDPETTMWLTKQCHESGCAFLDCPFTKTPRASWNHLTWNRLSRPTSCRYGRKNHH